MEGRRYLIVAALVIGALALAEALTSGGGNGSTDRRAAPALPTAVLTPPRVTVGSLKGRPAIVNFWASWCGPCRKEAPELSALSRDLHGKATLVGVNWNDAASGARSFIRKNGWTFSNLRDGDGSVGNAYRLSGLPNTFVLDSGGHIAEVLRGPQTVADFERALHAVD